jgi:hypothetical protein
MKTIHDHQDTTTEDSERNPTHRELKQTTTKRQEVLNLTKRTDKNSESSTESAVHTQILKQQKQLNSRNHHLTLNTNTE